MINAKRNATGVTDDSKANVCSYVGTVYARVVPLNEFTRGTFWCLLPIATRCATDSFVQKNGLLYLFCQEQEESLKF
jgi:hypothetical protein